MRLEKHTEAEINLARRQSDFALPNANQIEEWKKLHETLAKQMADDATAQLACQIIDITKLVWPYLSRCARIVAQGQGIHAVIEVLRNEANGVFFPWCKSGIAGLDYITEAALEGLECTRHAVLCRFLCKTVTIEKADTEKLEYWIKRFAAMFSKLADAGKIVYGLLGPFIALPLADADAEAAGMKALLLAQKIGAKLSEDKLHEIEEIKAKVRSESTTRRIALIVYPYSHFEREELNEWLGNPAFVEEGELGSDDWTGLPGVLDV